MLSKTFSRRNILKLGVGSMLDGLAFSPSRANTEPLFVSSRQSQGRHYAVIFNHAGRITAKIPLQARAHGGAFSPAGNHVVVFARRPGKFALVANNKTGHLVATLTPPVGRHFYGHGCFCGDGKLLFASENDFENAKGVISVWDVSNNYTRITEFEIHGIGPHEIIMLEDGKTLVVANGGIETHPETGRMKLNLFDMQPNLTWIAARNGRKIDQVGLPQELHKLSIRHLSANRTGQLAVGLQYQSKDGQTPPLAFVVKNKKLHWLKADKSIHTQMTNYCGSVCIDSSGQIAAISHPRGSLITFWTMGNQKFLRAMHLDDGCGIASLPRPGAFLLSGGKGALVQYNALSNKRQMISAEPKTNWDNHIST